MIESMACGTPIIAFPCGSVTEIIAEGVCGYIVNDLDEAVAAVRHIDRLDRRKCRQYFEMNFTDKRMACDYLKIYQKLAESKLASIPVEEEVLNWMEVESPTPSTT